MRPEQKPVFIGNGPDSRPALFSLLLNELEISAVIEGPNRDPDGQKNLWGLAMAFYLSYRQTEDIDSEIERIRASHTVIYRVRPDRIIEVIVP